MNPRRANKHCISSGTTDYRDGFKVFMGDVLQGRVFTPWTPGKDFDFEYRLTWIKSDSEYENFYEMCPLNGPTWIGNTIAEAMDQIDKNHEEEFQAEEKEPLFTFDDIPF